MSLIRKHQMTEKKLAENQRNQKLSHAETDEGRECIGAARMQEGYAVRQAQKVDSGRQDRAHAQMMRMKVTSIVNSEL
jgi:hypothetical protein